MRITIQYNSTGYSTWDTLEASGVMIWWGKGVVGVGCGTVVRCWRNSRESAQTADFDNYRLHRIHKQRCQRYHKKQHRQ